MRSREQAVALVAGGAGFIGSNLCDRLIGEGARVICLDNFQTGRAENLRHLRHEAPFEFVEHDVIDALPSWLGGDRASITHIYHLASAASPPHYQADPEHTLLTNVLGTRNLLRLAEETGGGYFELDKSDELAPTFTRVAQELHSQYVLGFTPTVLDGKVHASRTLSYRSRNEAELLATELGILGHDRLYEAAVAIAGEIGAIREE